MRLLVTGGAGFIGSEVVRQAVANGHEVCVLDNLTYAGRLDNLASVAFALTYHFEHADIRDRAAVSSVLRRFRPDAVMHLAAESHVDRSIDGPLAFVDTNVTGTAVLLDACLEHWQEIGQPGGWRFHHVSTDEVFGSLGLTGRFSERSPYAPNSPYAATKAASDHLVRAWHATYGLPVVVSNCSNNYGPYQFPEKLIPMTVLNAMRGVPIPVYGNGQQIRDWLYVVDHADALLEVVTRGQSGRTYAIGGRAEASNLEIVEMICAALDALRPEQGPHARWVTHVSDRPGHDRRYAVDPHLIETELGWRAKTALFDGIAQTVRWYVQRAHRWQTLARDDPQRGVA